MPEATNTSIDLTLRDDRAIVSASALINRMLAIVHLKIVNNMRSRDLDPETGIQNLLSVSLPGAVTGLERDEALGRRLVVSGDFDAITELCEDAEFSNLAKFYFRKSTAEDKAATADPTNLVFIAQEREKSTPAAQRRKLRRLQARAEKRGETLPEDVVAHLKSPVGPTAKPYISVRSLTSGHARARTLEIRSAETCAHQGYDLWGFARVAA